MKGKIRITACIETKHECQKKYECKLLAVGPNSKSLILFLCGDSRLLSIKHLEEDNKVKDTEKMSFVVREIINKKHDKERTCVYLMKERDVKLLSRVYEKQTKERDEFITKTLEQLKKMNHGGLQSRLVFWGEQT